MDPQIDRAGEAGGSFVTGLKRSAPGAATVGSRPAATAGRTAYSVVFATSS
jgi:hypothetical protein